VKGKIIPMLGLAVVFGGLSIYAADSWIKSQTRDLETVASVTPTPTAPAIVTKKVVVAKANLKFGTVLTADNLVEIDWPQDTVPSGVVTSIADLMSDGKRLVLSAFAQNEPVLLSKLSGKNGRASLSNLLEPGKRAVTVRIDDITGVAGFVTAGDRVDVFLTRQKTKIIDTKEGRSSITNDEFASEVVLQNVKVLTLDQNADETNVTNMVAKSVTFEVSSQDAQKVALAQQSGTLYLMLRAAADAVTGATTDDASMFNMADNGPQYRSLVVTRGHDPETYSVLDETPKIN
jgi:pilus assembly protein CpaB